jgi:SOS-response transcriptional repressor LexA
MVSVKEPKKDPPKKRGRKPGKRVPSLEPKPYQEIGRLVRDLRISAGMTQFDLADAIDVNNSYLSRIENGERRPSTKIMRKMADVLNYSYDEIVMSSGLLSPEFREKRSVVSGAGEVNVLKDIQDIKAVLSRLMAGGDPRGMMPAPRTDRQMARRSAPVFSRVPAGYFDEANVVEAYDDVEHIALTEEELGYDPKSFGMYVKGDSMIEAGILDGDLLIVSPNTRVVDGDIAVVELNRRETTVKIVFYEQDHLLLQPANSAFKPMMLRHPDQVKILGKVVLVRRKLVA